MSLVLLVSGLAVSSCTEQPGATAAPTGITAATSSIGPVATTASPNEASGNFVSVLDPYHNEFRDAPTYLIPKSITLTHPLPAFPESVPAQRITSEPLPDTDLHFVAKPGATGQYLWLGAAGDGSDTSVPLASQDEAAEVARVFLEEHGLWSEQYSAPQVSEGSSVSGPAGMSVTSWRVRFDRQPAAAGLERYVSVRVAGADEVTQLLLAIPQVEPVEDGLIRLRPIAEVIHDTDAWQMGDSAALQNEIQGEVAVEIRSASLALEDPGFGEGPIAVPVYRFEVEVRSSGGEAKTGFWSVVAASDVVRDSAEDKINDQYATEQAENALRKFFQAWAAKNLAAWKSLLSNSRQKDMKLGDWTFADLDHVEFGPITEAQELIEPWLRGGDRGVTSEDVRCFRAVVTFYYKPGVVGSGNSGEHYPWAWFVIREPDGQWRVADWGA